jgi:drug/metabolite transporter (DMT)-like permease
MPTRSRTLAVLALLATATIWGTTFVATKVALLWLPPLTLALVRFVLAFAVLLPLFLAEQRRTRAAIAWRHLSLAGLVGGCLYFACQNVGLVYTTASKTSLILACIPARTGVLSLWLLGESMGLARGAGVAVSIAGVAVVVAAEGSQSWQGGGLLGDLLILGSAASWAAYTVHVKSLEGRVTPTALTWGTMGFGALFLLPPSAYELASQPIGPSTAGAWWSVVYLGVVASAVPFLLWNYALRSLDASEAAVYTNLVPVVAIVGAVALLDERVVPAHVVGGAIVLFGVWVTGRRESAGKRPDDRLAADDVAVGVDLPAENA